MREGFQASAPGVPFGEVLTMADSVFRLRWVSSFFSRQLVAYAILAMIIAAVGLYGLTADSVSRRTRELAIRTALGAERTNLIRLIVVEAVKLGVLGVGIGVALSLGVTRFAARMLVDVGARDPLVFTSVTVLLLGVVIVAAFVPARRASALDPIRALRIE
jgi:ABC-type antimicrobial peptide transport system permease subunit